MTRIVIFAKAPVAGRVKTRLIPALGAEGAAVLAREMLEWTIGEALATGFPVELCGDPDAADWHEARPGLSLTAQGEGGLGERLARAAERGLAGEAVLLVGADCPELDRQRLREAAASMEAHDAVIHPAHDGGYVLLGLRRYDPSLFEGIGWSTDAVAAQTMARIEALGWSLHMGETLRDIDEPEDLRHPGESRDLSQNPHLRLSLYEVPAFAGMTEKLGGTMHPLPPYAELLGLRTERGADGGLLWVMPFREEVVGRPGFLHGGAIAGLLEFAALGTLFEELGDGATARPINVSVDFMRGGTDHDTFAAAVVTRLGSRVANVEAHAWQQDRSRPIAAARMNLMVRRDPAWSESDQSPAVPDASIS